MDKSDLKGIADIWGDHFGMTYLEDSRMLDSAAVVVGKLTRAIVLLIAVGLLSTARRTTLQVTRLLLLATAHRKRVIVVRIDLDHLPGPAGVLRASARAVGMRVSGLVRLGHVLIQYSLFPLVSFLPAIEIDSEEEDYSEADDGDHEAH